MLIGSIAAFLVTNNLYAATPQQKSQESVLDKHIHDYILAHPEVISEAVAILAKRSDQAKQETFKKEFENHRKALVANASDIVLQPSGSKELVEFYDIQCPHCARAIPGIEALLHKHPDVRLVLKNTPIFGPLSEESAILIAYAAQNGKDAYGIYQSLISQRPLSKDKISIIANSHGISHIDLENALKNNYYTTQYTKNLDIAKALGVQGTPTFIMNGNVSIGEDVNGVEKMVSASSD